MYVKRLCVSLILGTIFGVFCVIGSFLLNSTDYLIAAWYNRVIMGVMIGLGGEIKLYKEKDNLINSILRGAIIGSFVSFGFAFFLQSIMIIFFFAGIIFGLFNDLITTKITKSKD